LIASSSFEAWWTGELMIASPVLSSSDSHN